MRNLITLTICLLLSGCVFKSAPENNMDFRSDIDIRDLAGVYNNAGDPPQYSHVTYLSSVLWGGNAVTTNAGEIPHSDIKYIQVEALGREVRVSAIGNQCVLITQKYIQGKEFQLSNGTLTINRDTHVLSRGVGDVLLGPSYESVELGIDTKGDGKYRRTGAFAGAVFLLVPVVATETADIRFKKEKMAFINAKCK